MTISSLLMTRTFAACPCPLWSGAQYCGWTLAACGVYFQVSNWMSVPFPLNILFLPATMCETYLQVRSRMKLTMNMMRKWLLTFT